MGNSTDLKPSDREAIMSIFDKALRCLLTKDWQGWAELYSEDCVFHAPGSPPRRGHAELVEWGKGFRSSRWSGPESKFEDSATRQLPRAMQPSHSKVRLPSPPSSWRSSVAMRAVPGRRSRSASTPTTSRVLLLAALRESRRQSAL